MLRQDKHLYGLYDNFSVSAVSGRFVTLVICCADFNAAGCSVYEITLLYLSFFVFSACRLVTTLSELDSNTEHRAEQEDAKKSFFKC